MAESATEQLERKLGKGEEVLMKLKYSRFVPQNPCTCRRSVGMMNAAWEPRAALSKRYCRYLARRASLVQVWPCPNVSGCSLPVGHAGGRERTFPRLLCGLQGGGEGEAMVTGETVSMATLVKLAFNPMAALNGQLEPRCCWDGVVLCIHRHSAGMPDLNTGSKVHGICAKYPTWGCYNLR